MTFPSYTGERRFSPMDRSLRRELKSKLEIIITGSVLQSSNAVEIKIKSEMK